MDAVERLFWSLAIFFGVHFLWLGFIEAYLPILIGTVIAAAGGLWFFFRGFRHFADSEAS